jgi:hypothetical protein
MKKVSLLLLLTTLISSCVNNRMAIPDNDPGSDTIVIIQYTY